MSRLFPQAGFILLACVLFLNFPARAFPQEILDPAEAAEKDDFFDDDILSLEEDEGITVTASPETTQQMAVIAKEEIARRHAPDLAALLQDVLDLGVTRYGAYGNNAGINLRGFDSKRIAFLVDGVPAASPQGGEFDINRIDPASIERIEVIYGGSDTKYNVSGALGGVINIITVKEQEPGLRMGGSISNTSALPGYYREWDGTTGEPHWEDLADTQAVSFSASYGAEHFSLSADLFANRAQNHFLYRDDIFMRTRRKESNEIHDGGLRLSFVRDLGGSAKLILSGDAYYGDKNIPKSGFSTLAVNQKDFSTAQNIMLDMPRAFHDALSMEASITHDWHNREFAPSRHDEHLLTAINRWSWYPAEKLTLRAGGDYRYTALDSTDIGIRNRHDGGLYVTAEYRPHEQFLIVPSIKGAFSDTRIAPVPKLGFLWTPAEALTLKLNGFRVFKFPDFQDLYWSGGDGLGNPGLKPEDGWGGDLGCAYIFTEWLNLESAVFGQWYNDSIHWYPDGGVFKPVNVGGAVFFGLDSKLRIDIPLDRGPLSRIGLSLSYQYMLNYLLAYGYTFADDKRIPYMPDHTIGLSLDIPWNTNSEKHEGSILFSAHYETRRYAEIQNISLLAPYCLLNLHINQKLGRNLAAFAVFRNLLNTSYESFKDYPMPGLTVTLGIRMNVEGIGAGRDGGGD